MNTRQIHNSVFIMLLLLLNYSISSELTKKNESKEKLLVPEDTNDLLKWSKYASCSSSYDKLHCDEKKNRQGPFKCDSNSDCRSTRVCFLHTCTSLGQKNCMNAAQCGKGYDCINGKCLANSDSIVKQQKSKHQTNYSHINSSSKRFKPKEQLHKYASKPKPKKLNQHRLSFNKPHHKFGTNKPIKRHLHKRRNPKHFRKHNAHAYRRQSKHRYHRIKSHKKQTKKNRKHHSRKPRHRNLRGSSNSNRRNKHKRK